MKKEVINLEELKGKVFTTEAVAEILGLTADQVRRKVRAAIFPVLKLKGEKNYIIRGDDLAAYLSGEDYHEPKPRRASPKPKPPGEGELPYSFPKPEANRIFKKWFDGKGIRIKDFTEATGIEGPKVSRILSEVYAATRPTAEAIIRAYGDEGKELVERMKKATAIK